MINLRYHIVSITAVFLALGIGLVFGSSFIDAATVEGLRDNLEAIEGQNDSLRQENTRLRQRLDADADEEEALRTQALAQLVDGDLAGIPVLVVTVDGVDPDLVQATADDLAAAGAELGGVLWLTDRLVLDDEAEVTDLADVLQLGVADPGRLRASLARRLGADLAAAAAPADPADPLDPGPAPTDTTATTEPAAPDGGTATTPTTTPAQAPPTPEPELFAALRLGGFVELDAPPDPPAGFAVVPEAGLRLVVVSGDGAVLADADLLVTLVERIADTVVPGAPGPVVVVAQRGPDPDAELPDGVDPAAARVSFVGPLRDSDVLRERVSTVDHLERFSGRLATVLALRHGAVGQRGHYGIGPGAQGLLPPAPTPEGE